MRNCGEFTGLTAAWKSSCDHNFWMWNLPSRRAKWGNEGLKCKTTGDSYPGRARLRTPWVAWPHACVFCVLVLQRHVHNVKWGGSGLCVYDNKTGGRHRRKPKFKKKNHFSENEVTPKVSGSQTWWISAPGMNPLLSEFLSEGFLERRHRPRCPLIKATSVTALSFQTSSKILASENSRSHLPQEPQKLWAWKWENWAATETRRETPTPIYCASSLPRMLSPPHWFTLLSRVSLPRRAFPFPH